MKDRITKVDGGYEYNSVIYPTLIDAVKARRSDEDCSESFFAHFRNDGVFMTND